MSDERKHLLKRGRRWWVQVIVPKSLRPIIGKAHLRKSLSTEDLREASFRKHRVVGEFKAIIEKARRGKLEAVSNGVTGLAMALRQELERAEHARDFKLVDELAYQRADAAEAVQKEYGLTQAQAFHDVASGRATPLAQYHDDWLRQSTYTERTKADHKHALGQLSEWLVETNMVQSLEAITDKSASKFVTEYLVAKGANSKTANKLISGISTYWKWLVQQGHVERNPWIGKSLPKPRAGSVDPDSLKRPLSDGEVRQLLNGPVSTQELRDAIGIAALSGLRIEEIFQLKVGDCENELFRIRVAKTRAGQREVPIHSMLTPLIIANTLGKPPDEFLLASAKATGWGNNRSMATSKRFASYRKRLGIHEVVAGKRQSRVDFHSLRRWFITKADEAGCRKEDVERVVGHKAQGESFGRYSGGSTKQQLRAVVESVRLPDGCGIRVAGSRPVA